MKTRFRTLASLASLGLAAALLCPATATAASSQSQQQQAKQQQGTEAQAMAEAGRIHTVRGQLLDLRQVNIDQDRQPHLVAKLRTQRGNTAFVDLGRVQDVRGQDITFQRNRTFEAQGVAGRINDRPMLVAMRIKPESQQVVQLDRRQEMRQLHQAAAQRDERRQQQITQQSPQQQRLHQRTPPQQQRDAASRANRVIEGEVVETRRIQLNGMQSPHTLAKLRRNDGSIVVVDLGERDALQGFELELGERAIVRGTSGRISGRPVLVAREVAQVAYLDRTDFLSGASGSQAQQARQQSGQGN